MTYEFSVRSYFTFYILKRRKKYFHEEIILTPINRSIAVVVGKSELHLVGYACDHGNSFLCLEE